MSSNIGYGQAAPWDFADEFTRLRFVIQQMLSELRTHVPVKVTAVHGGGVAATSPTVDVQPLINELDGNGNPVKHGIVYGAPVLRLQGGVAAIVVDPVVGDVGYLDVSDRDTSAVEANPGQQVNPASYRQYALADGIYVGGILNAAPTVYVLLNSNGIQIVDANGNKIQMSSTGITITAGVLNAKLKIGPLAPAANDAAAAAAGVVIGGLYANGSVVQIRIV